MLEVADERVQKLKNAALPMPESTIRTVSAAHVMYVLQHADNPELYHGLPKDPQIDTPIDLWKGVLKPLSAIGFIATFAGLVFHYVGIGPNKETDDEEEEETHHE